MRYYTSEIGFLVGYPGASAATHPSIVSTALWKPRHGCFPSWQKATWDLPQVSASKLPGLHTCVKSLKPQPHRTLCRIILIPQSACQARNRSNEGGCSCRDSVRPHLSTCHLSKDFATLRLEECSICCPQY